jgi:hypothetical protein
VPTVTRITFGGAVCPTLHSNIKGLGCERLVT